MLNFSTKRDIEKNFSHTISEKEKKLDVRSCSTVKIQSRPRTIIYSRKYGMIIM